jgi:hypothetical protein
LEGLSEKNVSVSFFFFFFSFILKMNFYLGLENVTKLTAPWWIIRTYGGGLSFRYLHNTQEHFELLLLLMSSSSSGTIKRWLDCPVLSHTCTRRQTADSVPQPMMSCDVWNDLSSNTRPTTPFLWCDFPTSHSACFSRFHARPAFTFPETTSGYYSIYIVYHLPVCCILALVCGFWKLWVSSWKIFESTGF